MSNPDPFNRRDAAMVALLRAQQARETRFKAMAMRAKLVETRLEREHAEALRKDGLPSS